MGKAPAFQFYVKDWLTDPQLRLASASTKGIWIDLLCYMWTSDSKGILELTNEQIIKLTGAQNGEVEIFLAEAKQLSFCDICVTDNGLSQICNRRMYREEKNKENNRLRQKRYREAHPRNGIVTPPSPTPSSPTPSSPPPKLPKGNLRTKACPHQNIIDQYHKILPELSHIQVWDKTSKQNLKVRWRENPIRQDIEFWKAYFTWIKESKFLMGENDRGWMPDLHWLVNSANFAKVVNGRYHNNQNLTDRLRKVGHKWLEKTKEKKDT